jgi:hypothetical protein
MKTIKITYWTATANVALMMGYSAYAYLTDPMMKLGFAHLGYPQYFRVELGIAKLIGAVVLLVPAVGMVKEWAYAGFGITFISAFIAHTAGGDPVFNRVMPLIFFGLLMLSYWSRTKMQKSRNTATGHVTVARTAA